MNHQIKIFIVLELDISFSYVLLSSSSIIDQILNASGINTQSIITCSDVCSSTPHGQSE